MKMWMLESRRLSPCLTMIVVALCGCSGSEGGAVECAQRINTVTCPVGSEPFVATQASSACSASAGANRVTMDGELSGSCQGQGSCTFACRVTRECECGYDRITNNEVVCAECPVVTVCGDGRCESPQETIESCPTDCTIPDCTPGTQRCNGEQREQCNQRGGWEIFSCGTGEVCQENNGVTECVMASIECVPGQQRCVGTDNDQIQTCTPAGRWDETVAFCTGGEACYVFDNNGTPNAECRDRNDLCNAGEERCNGDDRQECANNGLWENPVACTSGLVCKDDGNNARCVAPDQCVPDCDASRRCVEGTCISKECLTTGDFRCVGGLRQQCDAQGAWVDLACPSNEPFCDDSGGTVVCTCVPNCVNKLCGDDGCGGSCGDCGPNTFCEVSTGLCTTFTCADGDERCSGTGGNTRQSCRVDQLGWMDIQTCTVGTCLPVAGNTTVCGSCMPGSERCTNDNIERCSATQTFSVVQNCAANEVCQVNAGSNAQCVCVPNCSATGSTCGSDGCGGSCGSCPGGNQWSCNSGSCVCTPSCALNSCDSDGCGGICTCQGGQLCSGTTCAVGIIGASLSHYVEDDPGERSL